MNDRHEWSVQLVWVRSVGLAPGESIDMSEMGLAALEELDSFAPSFTYSDDRYSIRVAIDNPDPTPAMETAIEVATKVRDYAGLPNWPLAHVEATDWDEFERGLSEPVYPDLLGVTELADLLRVSKQRASELARQSTFPAPIAQLASGPVWLEPTVRRFITEWKRRPGRPRMTKPEADAVQSWDKDTPVPNHPGTPG